MNVLQYNIYNGCREEERWADMCRWLLEHPYDITGFNELCCWGSIQDTVKRANRCGYEYAWITEAISSGFQIGLFSRYPIRPVKAFHAPFVHAAIHVQILDINILITHLSPWNSNDRIREVQTLLNAMKDIRGPLLLMGDLNTLSPLDRAHYESVTMTDRIKQHPKLTRKYLNKCGAIDYTPMQMLLDAGLHDPAHTSVFRKTIPTMLREDKAHSEEMRIDYILCNEEMMMCKPAVKPLTDPPLDMLSDHYPVACRW